MKKILILFALTFSFSLYAQKISVRGNWNMTLNAANIGKAGLDYKSSYVSKKQQATISISPIPNSWYNKQFMPLKVYVEKEDYNWHPNIVLEIKVVSRKHGNSSGTRFQEITNHPNFFFQTVGEKKNIPIQYRVSGLSVTLPVDSYTTEIIYTVLNL